MRKGGGAAGVEALHPSATRQSARVIHGSHFASKSGHKSVRHEKAADTPCAARTVDSDVCGDVEKSEEN
ncbi:Hypothetical protein SMAX5B_008195 [Scophthalmus maximus]|uniref:Uncharacterized protein n=1 Tax=Scophthalmus maximus TaxID=52904 RepID=A0A2U9CUS0_SCOMX|nr:Hypothetical protein SMAX5B_008195 [Scophthalmus maximus]